MGAMASTNRSVDWLAGNAQRHGDRLAAIDLATDRRFTYTELNGRAERLATVLHRTAGVGAGDRVAILAHNSTNTFEVHFACWKLGAVFVPLNWRLTVPELSFIVGDCTPKVIVHDGELEATAAAVASSTGVPTRISWSPTDASDAMDYEDALASTPDNGGYPPGDPTHDSLLCIMYNSGTTGRPKGAKLTHGQIVWTVLNLTGPYALGDSSVNLAVLPLFHIGGLVCFAFPVFHYGGTNLVMKTFEPERTLGLLAEPDAGITHFLGVPANYLFMSQLPAFADASFPRLTAAIGGSPTPLALLQAWQAKGVALQQGYGMTETASMVSGLDRADASRKIGSAGTPAMHVEVRIVDEHGDDVPTGELGELWVRGPSVTPGYWNRPDANAESFTDGWLHTGDAVRQDAEGHLYVVDRWKDMYISGGENVYPAEVENVIANVDGVGDVAVIGVPDDRWVEVGCAYVVRRPGSTVDEATIIRHCSTNLAKFKVPRSVLFIDELPRNASGKVLKRELRAAHRS
jgi:fatty-acyl-CoA synthase